MSENPVIKAQNNRGYWLPVTVVVISRPLLFKQQKFPQKLLQVLLE
jgi:hypothetical protein